MTMTYHDCPGPGCTARVPYEMLACRRHWRQVPQRLQNRVYATWEDSAYARWPLDEHAEAIQAAIATMRPL
jgi:hypothetical protein